MLNSKEMTMLNIAIETRVAQLERSATSAKDEEMATIYQNRISEYAVLKAKINTKELFNETQISKQK